MKIKFRLKRYITILFVIFAVALFAETTFANDEKFSREDESSKEQAKFSTKPRFTYLDFVRVVNNRGAKSRLAPQVRITSPVNNANVAPGEGMIGNGSTNGTGFAINIEVFTRDDTGIKLNEATQVPGNPGIRNADLLGQLNPEFPGLFVFINQDLITPTGEIIPKNTNLATLFNVAGTDDTPGPGITAWVGWHVLETFPVDVDEFTITAAVADNKKRIGVDKIDVNIDRTLQSGNALTPPPSSFSVEQGFEDGSGPLVEIIAPRVPSAIAVGEQNELPNAQTGSLNFIQVNILDINNAGIAVDEVGDTVTFPEFGPGSILDPTQLGKGFNRNFPGLHFSFDVPLQAPNGLFVEAGGNLAPVFNIIGSEVDPLTGATRVVADWVVGGSLVLPQDKEFVTFTAAVTDNIGKIGTAKRTFRISSDLGGQFLTPAP